MNEDATAALADCIDTIESSYEFMLAYAAQGRDVEAVAGAGPTIRQTLGDLAQAIAELGDKVRAAVDGEADGAAAPFGDFLEVLDRDAGAARAAADLVLSVPSIGSQLIDNLNASIHLRALLTDIFLIDEALKSVRNRT